jgi:hypothetical protein
VEGFQEGELERRYALGGQFPVEGGRQQFEEGAKACDSDAFVLLELRHASMVAKVADTSVLC